jgi:hypothetical protein
MVTVLVGGLTVVGIGVVASTLVVGPTDQVGWGTSSSPNLSESPGVTAPAMVTASPSIGAEAQRSPLAVVTGYSNPLQSVSVDDLESHLASSTLMVPCGIDDLSLGTAVTCDDLSIVLEAVGSTSTELALLPPGVVSPAVKVLFPGGARGRVCGHSRQRRVARKPASFAAKVRSSKRLSAAMASFNVV